MVDFRVMKNILFISKKAGLPIKLTVDGISMLPILKHGDVVTIKSHQEYKNGDIVVFFYKNKSILIHRIINIKGEFIFCKGDNAIRIEQIINDSIIGKVVDKM